MPRPLYEAQKYVFMQSRTRLKGPTVLCGGGVFARKRSVLDWRTHEVAHGVERVHRYNILGNNSARDENQRGPDVNNESKLLVEPNCRSYFSS